ncbi:LPXTG cell wall anchor domain-containing protein [Kitasatospora sp. NPDC001539]|uniref:LPXTG cell wall anchor domain-containing protein n=1 Tax=Kitasatospora sp. NPDC001539 TaxID=3154384 RepID=UPI00332BFCEA
MHIRSTAARSLVAVPTAAALLLLAPAAHAAAGGNGKGAPGNNGTVKIHDAATGQEDVRNEPKVCTFYLDSFGFDPNQDVIWAIVQMDHGQETLAAWGDLPVDGHGHVRTEDIELPDGQYKLYWQSVELVNGELPEDADLNNPKHKVFKVDCGGKAPSGKPSPTATKTPSAGPTTVPSATPSHSASPTPTHTPTQPPTQTPAPTHSATPSTTPVPTPPVVQPPVPTLPANPAPTTSAPTTPAPSTPAPSTPAAGSPSGAPSTAPSAGPSSAPTATVPVNTSNAGTVVNPDKPLIKPAKVSVPTPIPGAASDGKKLASTGSDGTLLYAGAGTVLLAAGAGAVVYARRRRTS